jgi:hypothetical protein
MSEFPIANLLGLLRQFSEELAFLFGCPLEMAAALCLAMVGAAISNAATIEGLTDGDRVRTLHQTRLFVQRDAEKYLPRTNKSPILI